MAKDAAYKCRTQHTLIMVMCWDHNKSDLRFDTRACGGSPLGSGGCNGPQTQAVVFLTAFLLVSIRHTQNQTHRDSDVIEDGVWSTSGGSEEADWPQTCKFTPLKTDRSWFMGVCIPPRAPTRASGVWFMSLWGYKSEFVFSGLHLFTLFVALFHVRVLNNATRCVIYTREKLYEGMERACVPQVGTLWMTWKWHQRKIIELKGKLGPFLHHAILLFSIWGLKNTFLLFAFEYRV